MLAVLNYKNKDVSYPLVRGNLEDIDKLTSSYYDKRDLIFNSNYASQINFIRNDLNLTSDDEDIYITYKPGDIDVHELENYTNLCGDIKEECNLKVLYSNEAKKTELMMLKQLTKLRLAEYPDVDSSFYIPLTSGEEGYFFARVMDERMDEIEIHKNEK